MAGHGFRSRVIDAVGRESAAYRVLRNAYRPVASVIGAAALRFGHRFEHPPVIIGGAPRSGTTLLLSMLAAHPNLWGIDHETFAFCPRDVDPSTATPDDFELARVYAPLGLARGASRAGRWVEKTPRNVHFFGPILEHFGENVRLIHIVRDGRDLITSRRPNDPGTLYTGVRGWVEPVKAGMAFDEHPQLHRLRYEDLVGAYETTMRSLLEFLGESWCPEIAAWHEHTPVRRHTAWRGEIAPLSQQSIQRWQQPEYAARVQKLLDNPEAAALLVACGYEI